MGALVLTRDTDIAWGMGLGREAAYTPVGYTITHVPDAIYPWCQRDVDEIRRLYDPGFIPIFRRMVYRSRAGGLYTFINHGVARWDRDAEHNPDVMVLRAQKPAGWTYGRANVVERWFGRKPVKGSIRAKHNLPHAFVPWGDWVVRWAAETYFEATAAEKLRYIEENGEAAQKTKERIHEQEEADYRQSNELSYQRRLYEQLGPDDEREIRAKMERRWRPDPKPFVHLTGAQA